MMSYRKNRDRQPKLTHHKASGQGVVRLGGKDHYCGPYGTPERRARAELNRLVCLYRTAKYRGGQAGMSGWPGNWRIHPLLGGQTFAGTLESGFATPADQMLGMLRETQRCFELCCGSGREYETHSGQATRAADQCGI